MSAKRYGFRTSYSNSLAELSHEELSYRFHTILRQHKKAVAVFGIATAWFISAESDSYRIFQRLCFEERITSAADNPALEAATALQHDRIICAQKFRA